MIRIYRLSRGQLLDTQIALVWQIDHCIEQARAEPSPFVSRNWCLEAARYVRAYRAISRGGGYGRKGKMRTAVWSKEITMLLMCSDGKRRTGTALWTRIIMILISVSRIGAPQCCLKLTG